MSTSSAGLPPGVPPFQDTDCAKVYRELDTIIVKLKAFIADINKKRYQCVDEHTHYRFTHKEHGGFCRKLHDCRVELASRFKRDRMQSLVEEFERYSTSHAGKLRQWYRSDDRSMQYVETHKDLYARIVMVTPRKKYGTTPLQDDGGMPVWPKLYPAKPESTMCTKNGSQIPDQIDRLSRTIEARPKLESPSSPSLPNLLENWGIADVLAKKVRHVKRLVDELAEQLQDWDQKDFIVFNPTEGPDPHCARKRGKTGKWDYIRAAGDMFDAVGSEVEPGQHQQLLDKVFEALEICQVSAKQGSQPYFPEAPKEPITSFMEEPMQAGERFKHDLEAVHRHNRGRAKLDRDCLEPITKLLNDWNNPKNWEPVPRASSQATGKGRIRAGDVTVQEWEIRGRRCSPGRRAGSSQTASDSSGFRSPSVASVASNDSFESAKHSQDSASGKPSDRGRNRVRNVQSSSESLNTSNRSRSGTRAQPAQRSQNVSQSRSNSNSSYHTAPMRSSSSGPPGRQSRAQ